MKNIHNLQSCLELQGFCIQADFKVRVAVWIYWLILNMLSFWIEAGSISVSQHSEIPSWHLEIQVLPSINTGKAVFPCKREDSY